MTGGRDGVVAMWDLFFEQCLKAFKVEEASMNPGSVLLQNLPPIRAIHTDEGKILIGTGNDEVRCSCYKPRPDILVFRLFSRVKLTGLVKSLRKKLADVTREG